MVATLSSMIVDDAAIVLAKKDLADRRRHEL
jgi:hypothetical protein